ncbi:DUF1080 domain-containing protein [Solirubrobacter taibaiensis]|nr:DUF1080 domain-containing protein [Solirubrobacter taibaiensis]
MSALYAGIPLSRVLSLDDLLPLDVIQPDPATRAQLDRILVSIEPAELLSGGQERLEIGLAVDAEVIFEFPALDGFALVLGGPQHASVTVVVDRGTTSQVVTLRGGARLRFPRDWLRPVTFDGADWVDDPDRRFSEIVLSAGVTVDQAWNVAFDGADALRLAPSMIGDTGFVIEGKVALDFSIASSLPQTIAMGLGPDWRGVILEELSLHLPRDLEVPILPSDLTLTNFHIGSGGISGSVTGAWTPTVAGNAISGNGAGSLFGLSFGLKSLSVDLLQGALTGMSITGVLGLPFFDHALDVELGLDLAGNLSLAIGSSTGIEQFTLSPGGVDIVDVAISRLGVARREDGVVAVTIGGRFTPLVGAPSLEWPTFDVRSISIDSEGNIELDGGWLDLPDQYGLNLYGFRLEIARIGFGKTDDGGSWIGFSGGVKLVEGMAAGASVDGLRITWYDDGIRDPRVTLDGVGVEFEVPEVVRFQGAISYRELEVVTPTGTEIVRRFDGDISLNLMALGLEIDATLVVGTATGAQGTYTFFAIYLGVELPAGIPLWSTGLALYGMAGLFALNMEPDRQPAEPWYGVGPNEGWYKRPQIGVTDLRSKWVNRRGSVALGAGVTIGTLADNGFTFAGRMLFVIVFPGPILMIEGKANLLKERAKLSDDPIFRTLLVLDGRAGHLLAGLDVAYKYGSGGELIDLRGGAEAFFDFHDFDAWHLYLGQKEPRERRIRADLFGLFEANAYLMLDASSLALGAWVGYEGHWRFGPASVDLEAWLEGNAVLSFKPAHFWGELWLHGHVGVGLFGLGFTLTADARAAADIFDPFHILLELHVALDLPWFLPDLEADLKLEWGPTPTPPPLPVPLKEVAVEHFKATVSWPLPRAGSTPLLMPDYDSDGDGFLEQAAGANQPANLLTTPVVPLDARPHVTFGRAVHDDAAVGVNPQPVLPYAQPAGWEWLGNPDRNEGPVRARFALAQIALEKRDPATGAWNAVAAAPAVAGVPSLYGSWAPVPQLPSGDPAPGTEPAIGQVKLWLWSKSAFDYTRSAGRAWDEAFSQAHPNYPCVPPPPDRVVCCDFQDLPVGRKVRTPWRCPDHDEVALTWPRKVTGTITALREPVDGRTRALCFPPGKDPRSGDEISATLTLELPPGARGATIVAGAGRESRAPARCAAFDKPGRRRNPVATAIARFAVNDRSGAPLANARVVRSGSATGLDCDFETVVTLATPAAVVELDLTGRRARVSGHDAEGRRVASAVTSTGRERLKLAAQSITTVRIRSAPGETLLHRLCLTGEAVTAVGIGRDGTEVAGVTRDGRIEVAADDLTSVRIEGATGICLVRVCVNTGQDPAEVSRHDAMTQHLRQELARWGSTGEVLEPDSDYRLRIVTTLQTSEFPYAASFNTTRTQTEYAYFRTSGPPGLTTLSTPIGHAGEFQSGLDDLSRYVAQTVPPTLTPPGAKPSLPRPVYRAYDVGVRFNEDYVDLMYRRARRDLMLQIYDANNRPVRDAEGRLIVTANQWGVAEQATLTESERRWLATIDASTCATIDQTIIPPDRTLRIAQGQTLRPDSVHEARLVPLLLHEDFSGAIAAWTAVDQAATGASSWQVRRHAALVGSAATVAGSVVTLDGSPDLSAIDHAVDSIVVAGDTARSSRRYRITAVDTAAGTVTLEGPPTVAGTSAWEIPALGAVVETSGIGSGGTPAADPSKPGTLLVTGDATWTDYRVAVLMRSATGGGMGVAIRYGPGGHYRFSMDRALGFRRLVRVVGTSVTALAEDGFVYRPDWDYEVVVEAVGPTLRVLQDGATVFAVEDAGLSAGRIALYAHANAGARFADVRVQDFREAAPVAYRFPFTTSRFAHFVGHMHSFDDEVWPWQGDVSAHAGAAVALDAALGEPEARTFEALATQVLGGDAQRIVRATQATAIEHAGALQGWLIESPEPIDWRRTSVTLDRCDRLGTTRRAPQALKLTDAEFGTLRANDEWVDVLLREHRDLSGERVEYRALPGALDEAMGGSLLFADDFDSGERGLLFSERLGPNALDLYAILDEGAPGSLGPSSWSVTAGVIAQTSGYAGGTPPNAEQGTVALLKSPAWTDTRITALLRSSGPDELGIVFRHDGAGAFYRFSMSQAPPSRRLVKRAGGAVTVLWSDTTPFTLDQTYRLVIESHGDRLIGWLDEALLFDVTDRDLRGGRVGLYCRSNPGARFEGLQVESLDAPPMLVRPPLADLAELEVIDDPKVAHGPSAWAAAAGVVTQDVAVGTIAGTTRPTIRGTCAILREAAWEDVQITARLRSDGQGPIGMVFRFVDIANHYRFAMDRRRRRRVLIRVRNGRQTVLWSDAVRYVAGQTYEVAIRAVGRRLEGFVDGELLFDVEDDVHRTGRAGFFTAANSGARFEDLIVADRARHVGGWRIVDRGTAAGPSIWQMADGALQQTSPIAGASEPSAPGTLAIGGVRAGDLRLSVRIRGDAPGAVGVVFRAGGATDHYRFSLDARTGNRRLVKLVGGTATTLWQQTGGFPVGEPFTVEIDAIGPRLRGRLDGAELFDVSDASHSQGLIGFYSWGCAGARFERVELRSPPLETRALFRDRFAEGDRASWKTVDQGTIQRPSAWSVSGAELRQTRGIYAGPTSAASLPKRGTQVIAGNPAWTDVIVTARLRSDDPDALGLLFRYAGANSFYRFSMDRRRDYRRLVRCAGGTFTRLWEDAAGFELGRSYELTISAIGSTLRGFLDGVPMFVVEDASVASGRIGLYTWANSGAAFSNVAVYDAAAAFRDGALDEPFDVLREERWEFVDESAVGGPSRWAVGGGELRQTAAVAGAAPERAGALALTGDPRWNDHRLSARMTPGAGGATGVVFRHQGPGEHYRFALDPAAGDRRLVRRSGGSTQVLWEDAVAPVAGREYVFTVDCLGSELTGYLDGAQIFRVDDTVLSEGRIGLYTWATTGAGFAEVRVGRPQWLEWYEFGDEAPALAGTRLRLYSGSPADPPAELPGVASRFAAGPADSGRIRLPSGGADLRAVGVDDAGHARSFLPDNAYVPLTPSALRVLRRADGTAFFLCCHGTTSSLSSLARGRYRLTLTYLRDNQVSDPESIVLSSAGDSSPEVATLDLPWASPV